MDGSRILVEEIRYLDKLRKVAVEAVTKFFSRNKIKHVSHIGENYCSGRNTVFGLGSRDVLVDCELGCFDDEILAIGNAHCEVMREEVCGKPLFVGGGDVIPNNASDCRRHANGAEFGGVAWVFVEAEKVGVAEVRVDGMWKLICEDDVEEELEVCVDGWVVQANQTVEGIYGIRNDAIGFAFGQPLDGGADVSWKIVLLVGEGRRSLGGYGWMWWAVEPLDNVLVDRGDACFLLATAGSLVCCTPVVTVCCVLDCFVGEAMRWRS